MFTRVYLNLLVLTYVHTCLPLFIHFIYVYTWLLVFSFIFWSLPTIATDYSCIITYMFTDI